MNHPVVSGSILINISSLYFLIHRNFQVVQFFIDLIQYGTVGRKKHAIYQNYTWVLLNHAAMPWLFQVGDICRFVKNVRRQSGLSLERIC